jgi:Domain of unknown function (DUF4157)/Protein-glutamine gamma-glutamyltransferase
MALLDFASFERSIWNGPVLQARMASPTEKMASSNWRSFSKEGRKQVHNERFNGAARVNGPVVQAKLEHNQPGDAMEQEADAMANQIVSKSQGVASASPSDNPATPPAIQRKGEGAKGIATPQGFDQKLSTTQGNGSPLPADTRSEMESGLGADLSQVRLHTDGEAVQLSRDIHAQAFTHGNDVYFNLGKLDTGSTEGKKLLAHELTHVVQQGSGVMRKEEDSKSDSEFQGGPEFEANLMKSALLFAKSGFGFLGKSQALYYWWQDIPQKKLQKEEQILWRENVEMGTANNPGMSLAKGRPSEAIAAIAKHPENWTFDCAMHCQIILLHAALLTIGSAEFDKRFENGGLFTFNFSFFDSSGLKTTKNIISSSNGLLDITDPENQKVIGGQEMWRKLVNEAPIGAIITMHTNDGMISPAWRNENILKVGHDQYSAHPFGVLAFDEILALLNAEADQAYPYFLFQIQHVEF